LFENKIELACHKGVNWLFEELGYVKIHTSLWQKPTEFGVCCTSKDCFILVMLVFNRTKQPVYAQWILDEETWVCCWVPFPVKLACLGYM